MSNNRDTSNGVELDEFHGQLYCVGAIVSGLLVADSMGIISTYSDEATLLDIQFLISFIAYFGTLLIGQFISINQDRIGDRYESAISTIENKHPKLSVLLPLSGEFGKYQIGWILGVVFATLILAKSFVGSKFVLIIYFVVLLVAVVYQYRREDTPVPSEFFGTLLTVTLSSTLLTYLLVQSIPYFVILHETVGPLWSSIISFILILATLAMLQVTRQVNKLLFHFVIGISFPIIVTAISVLFYLITTNSGI